MRKPIEQKLKRGAASARNSAIRAKQSAKMASQSVIGRAKDLDRKILDAASSRVEEFVQKVEKKTAIDLKGDIAQQLAQRILHKANQVKKSLKADEIKKASQRTGRKVMEKAISKSPLKKTSKKKTRIKKKPAKH